jgi:hypothetical protein
MAYTQGTCVRRDRASKDTENAIQLAHEDNHGAKAAEVLLSHARGQGVTFCAGIPLVPSLQDVKNMLSRDTRAVAHGQPARRQQGLTDLPCKGESTFFLGKGRRVRPGSAEGATVFNALGFFMLTQCADNGRGEWPSKLCTLRHICQACTIHRDCRQSTDCQGTC